jgi:hypothetical protein
LRKKKKPSPLSIQNLKAQANNEKIEKENGKKHKRERNRNLVI